MQKSEIVSTVECGLSPRSAGAELFLEFVLVFAFMIRRGGGVTTTGLAPRNKEKKKKKTKKDRDRPVMGFVRGCWGGGGGGLTR